MRERQLPAVRMIGGPAGLTDDARESFLSGWFQARVSWKPQTAGTLSFPCVRQPGRACRSAEKRVKFGVMV